jgi:hypothetical protein
MMSKKPKQTDQQLAARAVDRVFSDMQDDPGFVANTLDRLDDLAKLDDFFTAVIDQTINDVLTPRLRAIKAATPAEIDALMAELVDAAGHTADQYERYGYLLGIEVGKRLAGGAA